MGNPDATEGSIRRSGSLVRYWLTGSRDGPLVAFTHGAFLDHRMFAEQAPVVAARGYRVLCWDVRGHGLSKPIGEGFSVQAVAEDLLVILDLLGYEKAVLVGHSLGGYVAQEVALRRPERVEALVLIGSAFVTGTFSTSETLAFRLSPLAFRLWPYGDLKKRIANSMAMKQQVREYAREAAGRLSKDEFLKVWAALARRLREEPGQCRPRHPSLLVRGNRDRTGTGGKVAGVLRAGRETDRRHEVVIPGAGHNANQDNPAFFNRVLLEFLRERELA